MDNENGRALPEVHIPQFEKKKKKEKKTVGLPISSGGAARSAAVALAQVAAREGADAASRGFLPNLLAALAGKTAVVVAAVALGGAGAAVIGLTYNVHRVLGNSGVRRWGDLPAQSAGLAAARVAPIKSTIALGQAPDNTSLTYAAKAGRDELNVAASGAALGAGQKPGGSGVSDKTSANEPGAGGVAPGQDGNPAQGAAGGPGYEALPGAGAGPSDQMAHDLSGAKLSSSLDGGAGGASGAKVFFNDGKSAAPDASNKGKGQIENFSFADKQGAAGGQMRASHAMQAHYTQFAQGKGRAAFGKTAGRLGNMRSMMYKPGSSGVAETQVQNMVESWDSTALQGAGVLHPDKKPALPTLTPQGGGGAAPTSISFCSMQGDQYVDYFDNGKGDGGCVAQPKADVSQWTGAAASLKKDLNHMLLDSFIGLLAAMIFTGVAIYAAEVSTACSGGWGKYLAWAGGMAAIYLCYGTLMSDMQKVKQDASQISGAPGVKDLSDKVNGLVSQLQMTIYATAATALLSYMVAYLTDQGRAQGMMWAGIATTLGETAMLAEIEMAKGKIVKDSNAFLTDVNAHVSADEAAVNAPPNPAANAPHTNRRQ